MRASTLKLAEAIQSPLENSDQLTVVIAFEDAASRQWALQTYGQIIHQMDESEARVRTVWWKLDALMDAGLARTAAQSAAGADMIVIAAHGDRELPSETKTWIKQWLPHKAYGGSALVALLDGQHYGPAHRFLQTAASRGNMDFLYRPVEIVRHSLPIHVLPAPKTTGDTAFGVEETDSFSTARWGINE